MTYPKHSKIDFLTATLIIACFLTQLKMSGIFCLLSNVLLAISLVTLACRKKGSFLTAIPAVMVGAIKLVFKTL